jgi:hypothetical protein
LNTGRSLTYNIGYCSKNFENKTGKELKLSGLWYCNDIERKYKLNITEKIEKLAHKVRL